LRARRCQSTRPGLAPYFSAIMQRGLSETTTAESIETLLATLMPKAEHGPNVGAKVGDSAAAHEKGMSTISATRPVRLMALMALRFALLVLVFSITVVPMEAPVANALPIAARCGVPLYMFAALVKASHGLRGCPGYQFGERVHAGDDNKRFVVCGIVTSARFIGCAELIIAFVFGLLRLNGNPTVKHFGVSLIVKAIHESTVLRRLLVLAPMILLERTYRLRARVVEPGLVA
jgi:RND superfamily putative drug exporter